MRDTFDLSRDNTAPRSCADGGDGVFYRVASLGRDGAELSASPRAGCLEPGDEVLLIQLQGGPASVDNVGEHELLRVESSRAERVRFVAPRVRPYGAVSDESLADAVVILQRVPSYSRLEVREGGVVTARAWDGEGGGVLALRVLGDIVLDGSITMTGRGFRGGPPIEEALGHGQSGESFGGLGAPSVEPNRGGGGGGLGDQTTTGCVQDGNAGGGGAHRASGGDAVVLDRCGGEGRGRGGLAYAQAGRLFFGSGGGSGGVDNVRVDNPPGGAGGAGGGIVWLLGQSLTGSGRVEADGIEGVGDPLGVECQGGSTTSCYDHSGPGGGGAGGAIRLTVPQVSRVTLSVAGGRGGNGFDRSVGDGGEGSPGIID